MNEVQFQTKVLGDSFGHHMDPDPESGSGFFIWLIFFLLPTDLDEILVTCEHWMKWLTSGWDLDLDPDSSSGSVGIFFLKLCFSNCYIKFTNLTQKAKIWKKFATWLGSGCSRYRFGCTFWIWIVTVIRTRIQIRGLDLFIYSMYHFKSFVV